MVRSGHEAEGMSPIRKAGLATGWSADDRFSTPPRGISTIEETFGSVQELG